MLTQVLLLLVTELLSTVLTVPSSHGSCHSVHVSVLLRLADGWPRACQKTNVVQSACTLECTPSSRHHASESPHAFCICLGRRSGTQKQLASLDCCRPRWFGGTLLHPLHELIVIRQLSLTVSNSSSKPDNGRDHNKITIIDCSK